MTARVLFVCLGNICRSPAAEGVTHPSIDDLLTKTDSKYQLVLYSAKRARQINAYYSQLGEGLLEYVGPLVDTHGRCSNISYFAGGNLRSPLKTAGQCWSEGQAIAQRVKASLDGELPNTWRQNNA